MHFVSTGAHLHAFRRDEMHTFLGTLTDVSNKIITFANFRPAQGPQKGLFGMSMGVQKATQLSSYEKKKYDIDCL